jgi:glutathione S-transferase
VESIALYTFPGSNAGLTSSLLLEHSGLPHRVITLRPGLHAIQLRLRGFPGQTVPAMSVGRRKIVGTHAIAREVARLAPDAHLIPDDPDAADLVIDIELRAERLQNAVRRLTYLAASTDPTPIRQLVDASYGDVPAPVRRMIVRGLVPLARVAHRAREERAMKDVGLIDSFLREVDGWVEQGVLAGDHLNIADFQIAPNICGLTLTHPDARDALMSRPCWKITERILPEYPLPGPLRVPQEWTDQLLKLSASQ